MTEPMSNDLITLRVGPEELSEIHVVTPESLGAFLDANEPGTVWSPLDAQSRDLVVQWATGNPDSPHSEGILDAYSTDG